MLNTFLATDARQTLDRFRSSVDDLFDSFYGHRSDASGSDNRDRPSAFSPLIESGWTENALSLRAVIPGVPENDIRVSVQNNQLIIEGERKLPEGFGQKSYRQLSYGPFYTALTLPSGLNGEHIHCNLRDGILDIRVPVAEASKPRRIPIETQGQQKSVTA